MGKAKTLRKAKGFTLIELLIVIIIIGILATIAVISYRGVKAKASKAAEIQTITDAIKGVAICAAGGTNLVDTTPNFNTIVCSDTSLTSAKWPAAVANGYTISVLPTVTADGNISGSLTFTAGPLAPNNIVCTAANGTMTCI
ncbi:MAG: prepilin-type N-terminal cleavage/methylation domain-containing protein [bacterium]|nr:prepilin-type N-terminal cleavage/methylation domain-containing protein [bacterium]